MPRRTRDTEEEDDDEEEQTSSFLGKAHTARMPGLFKEVKSQVCRLRTF